MGIWSVTKTAAGCVVLIVGLSACTTGRSAPPPDGAAPSKAPSASTIDNPLPTTVHADSTSLSWHVQRVDRARSRIYLWANKKECSTPFSATFTSTDTTVTITVHGSGNDDPCTSDMVTMVGFVQLTSPLGSRRLLHANTSHL